MKVNSIQCTYNNETAAAQIFSVFDIAPKTDFTDCLSNITYSYQTGVYPIQTKNSNIQTPVYVKNRTITRKCCFSHPSIRAGCSNPVILRVCNTDDAVRKNINT